jgi:hypothetical protein
MALHELMERIEKALDQQERTLGVFLDIEGAFNNTCCESMCDALVKHGCDNTIVWWIWATLEGRVVTAILISSMKVVVSRWCKQGGVLSPLLWCLVVDDLIARLSGDGIYVQSYADMPSCSG